MLIQISISRLSSQGRRETVNQHIFRDEKLIFQTLSEVGENMINIFPSQDLDPSNEWRVDFERIRNIKGFLCASLGWEDGLRGICGIDFGLFGKMVFLSGEMR